MSGGEDGILGNLPRERPGRRSGKRDGAKGQTAAARPRAAKAQRPTEPSGAAAAVERPDAPAPTAPHPAPPGAPGDQVRDAARLAGQVAGAGIRVASRIAGGVLDRLPRP